LQLDTSESKEVEIHSSGLFGHAIWPKQNPKISFTLLFTYLPETALPKRAPNEDHRFHILDKLQQKMYYALKLMKIKLARLGLSCQLNVQVSLQFIQVSIAVQVGGNPDQEKLKKELEDFETKYKQSEDIHLLNVPEIDSSAHPAPEKKNRKISLFKHLLEEGLEKLVKHVAHLWGNKPDDVKGQLGVAFEIGVYNIQFQVGVQLQC